MKLHLFILILCAGLAPDAVRAANSGRAVAWGLDSPDEIPVPATTQSGLVAIAGGWVHSAALKLDGSVIAWGDDSYGQSTVPVTARSGVTNLAVGGFHTLALKSNGSVVAWGVDAAGQSDVPLAAQSGVMAVAAGWFHTLALKTNGSVVIWGYSGATVTAVAQNGVLAVAAGYYQNLALVRSVALETRRSGNKLILSWPGEATGCTLQSTLQLNPSVTWADVTNVPVLVGARWTITNTISDSAKFHRLRQP